MAYFSEMSDEFNSEINATNKDRAMETSDYRPSVSLHRKSPEKSKSKPIIRIGRRKPGDQSKNNSSNQSNGSLRCGVSIRPPPPAASATPHRSVSRYVNVCNPSGTEDHNQENLVRARSALIMANIQLGKKAQNSSLMMINKENRIPVPKLVNSTKVGEKPSDSVAAPKTPRQTLLTSLDDFSPSPVVRREPQEGIVIGYFSPDVDPPNSRVGLEARQLPESVPPPLARTSTEAVPNLEPVNGGQCTQDPSGTKRGQLTKTAPDSRHVPSTQNSRDALRVEATENPQLTYRGQIIQNPGDTQRNKPKSPKPQLGSDTPIARPIAKNAANRKELRGEKSKIDVSKKVPPKNTVAQDLEENNKIVKKPIRQKGRKEPEVVYDASMLEETPTFQKTPARFVNKEKRGVKRNKLKDKLDTHKEKVEEEQEDNVFDEEPPKKKSSPEINATNNPPRSLITRESDTYEWFGPLPPRVAKTTTDSTRAPSDDENLTSLDPGPKNNAKNSSTDANFKKPNLPLPKKKGRSKKGEEPTSSQEENSKGKLKPDLASEDNSRNDREAKASTSAKVGDKRKAEEPQEELMEKRYLNKWVPLLRNKKLYIEGDLINFDSVTPSDMSSKWMTSKIVSRISEKEVGTKKTCYVLEGQLAIPAPGERPMPLFVIDKFKNGFPENWKNIVQHWIHFNDQSMVTEATNQTILNNISSMTMTLFNSTPMPGMMSNINISNMSYIPDASRPNSKTPVKIAEKSAPSNITSLEKRVAGNIQEHVDSAKSPEKQISGGGVGGNREEQNESIQNRVPARETSPEKEKSKLATDRQGRSKVVRQTANRSTKNKPAETQSTQNNSSPDKKNSSSANTIMVDGKTKYPCEHCEYVGLQVRYLNIHMRKHKGLETTRAHSNSKAVKSQKLEQGGIYNRSLSESSVADMREGTLKNKQAIVNISNINNATELLKSKARTKSKASNDKTINQKGGSQLEHARPVMGRDPSDDDNISTEMTEPDIIHNKTMSLHDFSQLTYARNYQNTKMVQRQKFYLCQFCDYQCTNFKQVKDHLKKFHVDSENNEPDAPPKNFSPSPQLTKPQSKSPIKRKVKSKNKSPPVKSYGELFQAAQGQQEISAKKSRFGRKLMKNTSFNRTSWVDVTPSPDVHELQVTKAKKQASAKASAKKLAVPKRNISQLEQRDASVRKKSTKGKPVSKKAVEEQPSKPVRKVQNPFRIDGAGDTLTLITTQEKEPLQNIKSNPKTVKDRIRNAVILKDFNGDHEDDMFGISTKVGPKGDTGRAGTALGRLGNLDDSESENDISVHSSRTPITKYMGNKAWGNDVITPSLGLAKTPSDGSDIQQRTGFESVAFIHKKVIENKKEARDKTKRKLKSVLTTAQTGSQLQSEVEESTRIIDDMTMVRNNTEDDEEVGDDYFEDPEDWKSSCDPNSAMVKLYKERESKRSKQNSKK